MSKRPDKTEVSKFRASVDPNFTENKSKGFINYGKSNDLPSIIIDLVNNSNITQACLNTKAFFLRGSGFVDQSLKDVKVSPKKTITQLLNETSNEHVTFEGFAWKIFYNAELTIARVEVVPFETLRLGLPNDKGVIVDVKYKDNWNPQSGQKSKKEMVSYDLFNPDQEFVRQGIEASEQKAAKEGVQESYCQIYYHTESRPGARTYPIPQYMGGDWINIDGEISKFHYNNLLSGFFGSALVTLLGKTTGLTANGKEVISDAIQAIQGSVGSENAGNVAILMAETKEQIPSVQQLSTNGNSELFETLQNQAISNICIGTKVPQILAGIQTEGKLGQSQEILNAIDLFQSNIITPDQQKISACFKEVFQYWNTPITSDFEIKNVKPFNSIPDALLDVLSSDEKRALIGYDPSASGGDVTLAQSLGVGSTASLISILSDQLLTEEQKINTLQILFGLSVEDANRLIKTPDSIQQSNTLAAIEDEYLAEGNLYFASTITRSMIDEKYREYRSTVNMGANEYQKWASSKESNSSGHSRVPVIRTLELLNINKGDWNEKHYRWASQLLGFINRVKDMAEAGVIPKYGMSRKAIVMRNYAVRI